jgi:hypothetical protein
MENLAWLGYGIGAACMVGGGVLYWTGRPVKPNSSTNISFLPLLGSSISGLSAKGNF